MSADFLNCICMPYLRILHELRRCTTWGIPWRGRHFSQFADGQGVLETKRRKTRRLFSSNLILTLMNSNSNSRT